MHRRPTPKDTKPIDVDGFGFNARETFRPAPRSPLHFPPRTVTFSPRERKAALDKANRPKGLTGNDLALAAGLTLAIVAGIIVLVYLLP